MPELVLFVPTLVLIGGAALILLADLLPYPSAKSWTAVVSVGVALASVLSLSRRPWPVETTLFAWQSGAEDLTPVTFAYYLDAISFVLLLCALFATFGLVLYATHYIAAEPKRQLVFYFSVVMAAAAFVNLVLSGNMLMAYIGLQTWIIASFGVMAFWNHGIADAPAIARSFVLVSLPSTAVLVGTFAMASRNPSLAFPMISPESVAPPILVLFLLSAAAVSYQYPFHPWTAINLRVPLPAAALIGVVFSPLVGAYLLSRFHTIAGVQIETSWHQSLMAVGALSMVAGSVYALKQTHLKGIIIFIASAQLGYAFLGLGINTPASVTAALFTLISCPLAASGMMVCAGMIERAVGTGSVLKLGGLSSRMPRTTLLFAFFSLVLAGVPFPTVGFFAKWLILGAAVDSGHAAFAILTLVVDVLVFVMLVRTMDWVFFRRHYRKSLEGDERSRIPLISATLLAVPLFFFGIAPFWLVDWLIKPAVSLILHIPSPAIKVSLAGGFAAAGFWASAITFLLMILPLILGLLAYMVAPGNGGSSETYQGHRGSIQPADSDRPIAAAIGHGRIGWFPWTINTSGTHRIGWRALSGIAQALRKGMSPAEGVYSPMALLLAALVVLMALLE